MKLFFYFKALLLLLLIAALNGCSSNAENSGRKYVTQRMEATIPADTTMPEESDKSRFQDGVPLRSDITQGSEPLNMRITVAENVHLGKENIGGISDKSLLVKLEQIAEKTDIAVKEAQFDTKTWAIKKEKAGNQLDIDKILEAALSADAGEKIKYSYVEVKPKVKASQLEGKVKLISKFSTPLLDRSRSRVKNIRLSAKKIDRKIILPGQEFSFNNTTGSKSKKMGYEDATVIVRTPKGPKHKKAPGGGVCQLSTTIYNAVTKCCLKVTERHGHSDDVYYVVKGKDATVSYNGVDFKFINNRKYPIMLRIYVGKRTVQVRIYEKEA